MNVLFYTTFEVSPHKGGTERITSSISNGLRKYKGYKCFSAFSCKIHDNFEKTQFDGIVQLCYRNFVKTLRLYVIENDIDVIINQGAFELTYMMRQAIEGLCKKHLIFVHHFNPGAEIHFLTQSNLKFELRKHPYRIKNIVKLCFFSYFKEQYKRSLQKNYKATYEYSDKVVLLSDNFRPEFKVYAGIKDGTKFKTIHNSLSYDTFFDMTQYFKKKKEVLIVSRLDEEQKRISLALRIWESIEKDEQFSEWRLIIVGHGEMDVPKYQHYVKANGMSHVTFMGMQEPSQYYIQASLFMMTSLYEGWGLTLTEAQQFGCVPLAFNSYASLSDIITDGVNGYIIPECDLQKYTEKLKNLMSDDELRKNMASQCIEQSNRFEHTKIINEWDNLICNIVRD